MRNNACQTSIVVFCDFDGTVTTIDTAEFILARFAPEKWKAFERQFEQGQLTLEQCMKKQFSLVKASERQILDSLERIVTFRAGFEEMARYCRRYSIPFIIVSAGLDFVIKHFLEEAGWNSLVTVYAAKSKIASDGVELEFPKPFGLGSVNFKQDLVKQYQNRGKWTVFIGDGSGDYEAAKDADFRFAVRDSKLAKLCAKNKIDCIHFSDFHEVVKSIRHSAPIAHKTE
jgi:2-hydroxy-3-keto-5-methylthiopentenyl-1-phosphate phosphatase